MFLAQFFTCCGSTTDTTNKGQPNKVKWCDAQENAARSSKRALITNPILKLPDYTASFILQIDASEVGLVSVATRFCRVLIFASSQYLTVIYLFHVMIH